MGIAWRTLPGLLLAQVTCWAWPKTNGHLHVRIADVVKLVLGAGGYACSHGVVLYSALVSTRPPWAAHATPHPLVKYAVTLNAVKVGTRIWPKPSVIQVVISTFGQ